jgi:hypothetical protein
MILQDLYSQFLGDGEQTVAATRSRRGDRLAVEGHQAVPPTGWWSRMRKGQGLGPRIRRDGCSAVCSAGQTKTSRRRPMVIWMVAGIPRCPVGSTGERLTIDAHHE